MNKKQILVVSNGYDLTPLGAWILHTEQFEVQVVSTDEAAIELAHQQYFDLVLVDTTDPGVDARKLDAVLPILINDVMLLPYTGQNEGVLETEIRSVFSKRRAERAQRYLVLDSSNDGLFTDLPPFSAN